MEISFKKFKRFALIKSHQSPGKHSLCEGSRLIGYDNIENRFSLLKIDFNTLNTNNARIYRWTLPWSSSGRPHKMPPMADSAKMAPQWSIERLTCQWFLPSVTESIFYHANLQGKILQYAVHQRL
jgi:hypothetical protein